MNKHFPLTAFGTGIAISGIDDINNLDIEEINTLIEKYHFIVFKHIAPEAKDVQIWLKQFGDLVKNKRRNDDDALVLDGSKEQKEVLGGKGRMPLHCDGLLMNETIRLVCIYCESADLISGGRTYVSNNEEVWNRIPQEIKDIAQNNGIEIFPCDTSYYLKNDPVYYKFEGTQERDGKTYLNAGLHYHPNEKPSWKIRFANIAEETSYALFNQLEALFENDELKYYHDWEAGDLLMIDNVRVMHGREAYEGDRKLVQFQVRS